MSVTLSVPDPTRGTDSASFHAVADAAFRADGYRPFNEQALLDVAAGRRTALLLRADSDIVGAAIIGSGELDLVIDPDHRREGHADAALPQLLGGQPGTVMAWSHGDHPGSRALAARHGFEAVRTLLQLRRPLLPAGEDATIRTPPSSTHRIEPFQPGRDDGEWVAVNALVFAHHPEQGALTLDDLAARQAEPWFHPGDFLIARDKAGRMIGFNWLKIDAVDDPGIGEVYVIGIHPEAAGRGLGRELMLAGLARLSERECTSASLYVEADNAPAVHLYRSLGFGDHTVDVQYRRIAA